MPRITEQDAFLLSSGHRTVVVEQRLVLDRKQLPRLEDDVAGERVDLRLESLVLLLHAGRGCEISAVPPSHTHTHCTLPPHLEGCIPRAHGKDLLGDAPERLGVVLHLLPQVAQGRVLLHDTFLQHRDLRQALRDGMIP